MHALGVTRGAHSGRLGLLRTLRTARGLLRAARLRARGAHGPCRLRRRGAHGPGRLRSCGSRWRVRGRRCLGCGRLRRRCEPALRRRLRRRGRSGGKSGRPLTGHQVGRGQPLALEARRLAAHGPASRGAAEHCCTSFGTGARSGQRLARVRSQSRGLGACGRRLRCRPRTWGLRRRRPWCGVSRTGRVRTPRPLYGRLKLGRTLALEPRQAFGEGQGFGTVHVGRHGERLARLRLARTEAQLQFGNKWVQRALVDRSRLARRDLGAQHMQRDQHDVEGEPRGSSERSRKAGMAIECGGDGDGDHGHRYGNEGAGRPSLGPSAALGHRARGGHAPVIHVECRIVAFCKNPSR